MKVLLLHGYSASNAGDGLLVNECLGLLREALGAETDFTVAALHPRTFRDVPARIVDASPSLRGSTSELRDLLVSIDSFDLVAGVGGGYLRAGNLLESVKTLLAHSAQLRAAIRRKGPTVYLPQSVGPFRGPLGAVLRRATAQLPLIYLRDDRSVHQLHSLNGVRRSDLAVMAADASERSSALFDSTPVVSIREVRGRPPKLALQLAEQFVTYDAYIQSRGRGNDDVAVTGLLRPRRILERDELMAPGFPRVVVAVRLHAALMALNAGHYVVHLAYERKGFGAFEDLGLGDYVHNVNTFEIAAIRKQVDRLRSDQSARENYDIAVGKARERASLARAMLVKDVRELVLGGS